MGFNWQKSTYLVACVYVCVCVFVDVQWHQGTPLKGQLCIRREFWMKREERRKRREEMQWQTVQWDVNRQRRDKEICCSLSARISSEDISPCISVWIHFLHFWCWRSCPFQEHRCVQSVNFMFHLASHGYCPWLQSNHVKLPLSQSWFRLRRGPKTNETVSTAGPSNSIKPRKTLI